MDFFTSDVFLTIVSVVGSAIGVVLVLRADIGKRIDRVEKRIDRVEEGLGQRIDRVEEGLGRRIREVDQGLGRRIDRVEDRARTDHQELVTEIGKVKTAVSVLGTKLDERSAPRRLVVQEPAGDYAVGEEPEGGQEDGPEAQ